MLDPVRIHIVADRPEQAAWLGRTDISADVVHDTHLHTEQLAVSGRGYFNVADPVGTARAGAEGFQTIFNPFYGHAGFSRSQGEQRHVGVNGNFVAK